MVISNLERKCVGKESGKIFDLQKQKIKSKEKCFITYLYIVVFAKLNVL
jgi:hypothetical protein